MFLAYVTEDAIGAGRLYDALEAEGFSVWMDVRKLLPGQNWPRAIESAIETSDYFVACFSSASVNKKGGFQAEVRYSLDCARRMPLHDIFVTPGAAGRVPGAALDSAGIAICRSISLLAAGRAQAVAYAQAGSRVAKLGRIGMRRGVGVG